MLSGSGARAVVAHVIDPVARALLRVGITPDVVTVVGTIGVSAAALAFFPRGQWLLGTAVIILFVFSDTLDGTMARLSGRSGSWGAFLDSTLDRVADGAIFGSILLYFALAGDALYAGVALGVVVGAFLVSYIRARAESLGLDGTGGFAERTERLLIGGVGVIGAGLGFPVILQAAMWVLVISIWATAIFRMRRASRSRG